MVWVLLYILCVLLWMFVYATLLSAMLSDYVAITILHKVAKCVAKT